MGSILKPFDFDLGRDVLGGDLLRGEPAVADLLGVNWPVDLPEHDLSVCALVCELVDEAFGQAIGQAIGEQLPAVAEPEQLDDQVEEQAGEPKILPPYQVVLLNDDDHTMAYVVQMLVKVFRMDTKTAIRRTLEVHLKDRAAVWSGSKEVAELKRDQVRRFGPDTYASQTVTYPLGCVIEPMPQ